MEDNRHEKMKLIKHDGFYALINITKYIKQIPGETTNRKVSINGREVEVVQISPVTSYWKEGDAFHICEVRYKEQET